MPARDSGTSGPGGLAALARTLDPTGPVLREEVDAVRRTAGAQRHDQVRTRLRTISRDLSRPKVTVVFGGHFSSGKSTLINALLGRDLLPSGDYPETGVACWISSGPRDEVTAITDQGRLTLAVSRSAIAHEVSLIDGEGDYRRRPHQVRRVAVTLAGGLPPPGVTWVDSPGINDTARMTERARDAADNADLLVWVINSQQVLSVVEQRFLAEYAAARGSAGVLCLVNVFLPQDTPWHWDRYRDTRFAPVTQRIRQAIDDWAGDDHVEVAFVSARGAGAEPGGFGGPQLRALLSSVTSVDHPRVTTARLQRAAIGVDGLIQQVEGWISAEQADAARRHETVEERRGELERQRQGFERALRREIRSVFARYRPTARECVDVVLERIDADLRRDDTYADLLRDRLTEVADRIATELVRASAEVARAHQHTEPGDDVAEEIRGLLRPGNISVPVPYTPPRRSRRIGRAAIGAAIGSVIMPGLGTVVGGALGGMTGGGVSAQKAVEADRAAARTNAVQACEAAVLAMMARDLEITALLTEACRPRAQLVAAPGTGAVDSLRRLRDRLVEQHTALVAAVALMRRVGV